MTNVSCQSIPRVMKFNASSPSVQLEGAFIAMWLYWLLTPGTGCIAIWNLARDRVNASRIAEAEGSQVIVTAMTQHIKHLDLQASPPSCSWYAVCPQVQPLPLQVNALMAVINLAR